MPHFRQNHSEMVILYFCVILCVNYLLHVPSTQFMCKSFQNELPDDGLNGRNTLSSEKSVSLLNLYRNCMDEIYNR
jgi:hypothetical protein